MSQSPLKAFLNKGSLNLENFKPFAITIFTTDGKQQVVRDVIQIVFGVSPEDTPPLPSFWVECAAVAADHERIKDTINDYGFVDVLVAGRIHTAIEYVEPTREWDDDLIYTTGERLSNAWRLGRWQANPTRVTRLVDGFGVRE